MAKAKDATKAKAPKAPKAKAIRKGKAAAGLDGAHAVRMTRKTAKAFHVERAAEAMAKEGDDNNRFSVGELRAMLTAATVKGRSKVTRKQDMIALLIEAGIL